MSNLALSSISPENGQEAELWRQMTSDRGAEVRSRLFFYYSDWARMLAKILYKKYPQPLAEWADYFHFASVGLLQAIDRYDPGLSSRFQSYAEPYIRGAVIKGISCFSKDRRGVLAERAQSFSHGHEDGGEESSLDLLIDATVGLALGRFLELGMVDETDQAEDDPLQAYTRERAQYRLLEYVEALSPSERKVIVGHYYQHLSFTELSEMMQLSKPRISQLHKAALGRIRKFYENERSVDWHW